MSSSTPARLSCLRGGGCDAVPLGQPQDVLAQAEGYRLLGTSNEAVPEYLFTVTAARRSWAAANSELVVRYMRALAASFAMIREPARRAAVVAAIVDITAVPPAIAERAVFLAQRTPFELRWHGELFMHNTLAMEESQRLLASIGGLTATADSAVREMAGMPAQLSKERIAALEDLFVRLERERAATLQDMFARIELERRATLEQMALIVQKECLATLV